MNDDSPSIDASLADAATSANTDDAPITESKPDHDAIASEITTPTAPEALPAEPASPKIEDSTTKVAETSTEPVNEALAEPVNDSSDDPAPKPKVHHAKKHTAIHHAKKVKKVAEEDSSNLIASATADMPEGNPQAEMQAQQQAQMNAQATTTPTVAPTVAPTIAPISTPMSTPVPVPTIAASKPVMNAQSESNPMNDYMKYGAVGAVVLVGGYLVLRKLKGPKQY